MMSDVTLSDGREITVDLTKFNVMDYRGVIAPDISLEERADREDALISKAVGLTLDEYRDLPFVDWRRVSKVFYEVAREPLKDPN